MRFHFPVLPPGINASYRVGKGRFYKVDDADNWATGAALIVGGWVPPPRTPLKVTVLLFVPNVHQRDIDGPVKALLDVVIGPNRDQWVDILVVHKLKGSPGAWVSVEEIVDNEVS